MRTKLIAGNWKMNGNKPMVRELIAGILARLDADQDAEVLVLPPFPYLSLVRSLTENTPVHLGGQDLSAHTAGAYTGEVAGEMLAISVAAMCWSGTQSVAACTVRAMNWWPPNSWQLSGPVCSRSCV
jgi:triosephosphate isomerase